MARIRRYLILLSLIFAAGANSAIAGVWSDVAIGLGAAGFDLRGSRNPLSGGADFLATNIFQDATFDFGSMELTLDGPISLDVSTGGRRLSNLDIALTSAVNGDTTASPIDYELIYDVGGQSTVISGSLLLDAEMSLNGFGFYDLGITYSSRQTVDNEGRFSNEERNVDFDLGPINVSGNIFADMLAAVTQPFFEATNTPNIFASFSGRERLKAILDARLTDALSELDPASLLGDTVANSNGANRNQDAFSASVTGPLFASFEANEAGGLLSVSGDGSSCQLAGVVPEPTVLLLMLVGLPVLIRRTRRRPS